MRPFLAMMLAGVLAAGAAHAADAPADRAVAERFYDQWFMRFMHAQLVDGTVRDLEQAVQQQASAALGGQAQMDACPAMQAALGAYTREYLRPVLEEAFADPATRQALVDAVVRSFTTSALQAYLVQLRVKGSEGLVALQVGNNATIGANLKDALKASPLNMQDNAAARERVERGAAEHLGPAVERCRAEADQ
ncbi:hypothetical protein [Lysobacter sp.]|uniref:hypothetical protein n=1 Tax=Lysobacter sp. TaxID=72226 RepID=UPI002D6987C9|nr:hypothetical protein [Lysobacter sp.]HZX77504.1 hypothetical protein [Lysobacter sp.]